MRFFARDKMAMVEPDTALPGRSEELRVPERHEVLGTPLRGPLPPGVETAIFGMGCFWGAERIFWQADGVYTTAVGYAGGVTPNPTYEETCSGMTGHSEGVLVAFDTAKTSYQEMLRLFWEGHDPTQGMRQGNDAGTQYRSLLMWNDESQRAAAEASREAYQQMLTAAGHGASGTGRRLPRRHRRSPVPRVAQAALSRGAPIGGARPASSRRCCPPAQASGYRCSQRSPGCEGRCDRWRTPIPRGRPSRCSPSWRRSRRRLRPA